MELAYKKQNVFLYKFMPCLLFFMIAVMCLFGSYVQADTSYPLAIPSIDNWDWGTIEGFMPSYLNNEDSFYLQRGSDNTYFLVLYWDSSHVKPIKKNNDVLLYSLDDTSYTNYTTNSLYYHMDQIDVSYSTDENDKPIFTYVSIKNASINATPSMSFNLFYSSRDIYDTSDNLVFQAPPQQVEALGIIAEKTQGVEMNKTLAEITGILPVILVVIVGLIAIRKAILFLIARMKQA